MSKTAAKTVVADTILEQMGGIRRLIAFVGAEQVMKGQDFVQFKFTKGKDGISCVRVTLLPSDTYHVEFYSKKDKFTWKKVSEHDDIYFDMLIELFERTTGLYLHF